MGGRPAVPPQLIAGRGCRPPRAGAGGSGATGSPLRRTGRAATLPASASVAARTVRRTPARSTTTGAGGRARAAAYSAGVLTFVSDSSSGSRRATAGSARSAASSSTVTRLRANSSPGRAAARVEQRRDRRRQPDPVSGGERLAVAPGYGQRHVAVAARPARPARTRGAGTACRWRRRRRPLSAARTAARPAAMPCSGPSPGAGSRATPPRAAAGAAPTCPTVGADHDHDRPGDRAHEQCRRAVQQRRAVPLQAGLRRAHPRRPAARQHHPGGVDPLPATA